MEVRADVQEADIHQEEKSDRFRTYLLEISACLLWALC